VGNNTINDAAIMAALGRQMTRAVARQTVAASNLANLDTPGYHAREITFEQALDAELKPAQTGLAATNPAHFGAAANISEGKVSDVAGLGERRDGNNVQIDRELLGLSRASGDFTEAQTVLSAKFRLVRYAINEGR